jgi:hypothetical protein
VTIWINYIFSLYYAEYITGWNLPLPGPWGMGEKFYLYYLEYITGQNLPLPRVGVMETILSKDLAKHGIMLLGWALPGEPQP